MKTLGYKQICKYPLFPMVYKESLAFSAHCRFTQGFVNTMVPKGFQGNPSIFMKAQDFTRFLK